MRTTPPLTASADQTRRNAAMFGPPGRAYVYRIYGAHWCLNLVGGERPGAAALIRALAPTDGLGLMGERRGSTKPHHLCSGPGKLCQALAITGVLDGAALDAQPFALAWPQVRPPIVTGSRVGITKGVDRLWRFGWRGSEYLSRPFAA